MSVERGLRTVLLWRRSRPNDTATARERWLSLFNNPLSPAFAVLILYMLWLGIILPHSHEARDFINIGRQYVLQGHGSSIIKMDAYIANLKNPGGFDGQFCYFIALDPLHAVSYVDLPPYRYTRILYPLLARLLALGQPQYIPYALLAVNWLAIAGGTLAVAAWLKRRSLPMWFSLVYGLYPGLLIGVKNDLTEPLCYGLVAFAVYLFDFGGRYRLPLSAAVFALATLTRETAAVFPLFYGVSVFFQSSSEGRLASRARAGAVFIAMALGPLVLYKTFLTLAFGSTGTYAFLIETHPFKGILDAFPWGAPQIEVVRSVYAPAILCGVLSIWVLLKDVRRYEVWALLVNVLLYAVFLAPASSGDYTDTGRTSVGIVLAALFCLPAFDLHLSRSRWWLWSSATLWLSLMPFWLLVPIADSLLRNSK